MMARESSSGLNALLECVICQEELTDPRILICHHSFCCQCINDMLSAVNSATNPEDTNSITCPNCRQQTPIKDGKAENLPIDFRTLQIKDMRVAVKQVTKPCYTCELLGYENVAASAFCSMCSCMLCATCLTTHNNNRLTASHTVTLLGGNDNETQDDKCNEHKKPVNAYCLDCDMGVCFACINLPFHSGHSVNDLQSTRKVLLNHHTDIRKSIEALCQNNSIQEELDKLKEIAEENKTQYAKVKQQIQSHAQELIAQIHHVEKSLTKKIEDHENRHDQTVKDLLQVLEDACGIEVEADNEFVKLKMEHSRLQTLEENSKTLRENTVNFLQLTLPVFVPSHVCDVGHLEIPAPQIKEEDITSQVQRDTENEGVILDAPTDRQKPIQKKEMAIHYQVAKISQLQGRVQSNNYPLNGLPWNFMVMPHVTKQSKFLGIFLQCAADPTEEWSCDVRASFKLLRQQKYDTVVGKKCNLSHRFHSKEYAWGVPKFIGWEDLLNPDEGYIKDDTLTLEVTLSVSNPKTCNQELRKHSSSSVQGEMPASSSADDDRSSISSTHDKQPGISSQNNDRHSINSETDVRPTTNNSVEDERTDNSMESNMTSSNSSVHDETSSTSSPVEDRRLSNSSVQDRMPSSSSVQNRRPSSSSLHNGRPVSDILPNICNVNQNPTAGASDRDISHLFLVNWDSSDTDSDPFAF